MSNNVLGIVSIHRLRTGATVQLYLSSDKGLYQNVAGKNIVPNWSESSNQPTITPHITGVDARAISDRKWYNENGTEVTTDSIHQVNSATGTLKFVNTPVRTPYHNLTYTFKCKITQGGTPSIIERSIMVMVNEGGENSYWGNINAPEGTVMGEILSGSTTTEKKTVTLTPTLWSGANAVSDADYTVKWYKTAGTKKENGSYEDLEITQGANNSDGETIYALSGKSLIVGRDAVDGMAHFECRFFVGGNFVEAEGIQIADNADEYFIVIDGDKNVYTDQGGTAKLTAGVYKHKTNDFVACNTWDAVVTDSVRMNEYVKGTHYTIQPSSGKGLFTMNESNMYVPNTSDNHADYGTGTWLKCDVDQGNGTVKDVSVTEASQATMCDVTVQFIATL